MLDAPGEGAEDGVGVGADAGLVGLLPVGPLPLGGQVPGVGEGEVAVLARPAGVVDVHVGVDDGVDVGGRDACLLQAVEVPPPGQGGEVREFHVVVAEGEVDEDLAVARLDQEPSEGGDDPSAVVEPLAVHLPSLGCRRRDHRGRDEVAFSIGQIGEADVADGNRVLGSGVGGHRVSSFADT